MAKQQLFTSLDIGSDKVALHIGEALPDGQVRLLGSGIARSRGIEAGQIVDLDQASRAVREALTQAEERAGCEVYSVLTNVAGTSVEGHNSCGLVVLAPHEHSITSRDIEMAIHAAASNSIPFHEQVVTSRVQSFVVNQQEGIRNPTGMVGSRLGAYCHIVTAPALELENIRRCVRRAGLEVEDWLPDAVAAAHAVLTEEERELGVILVDIGSGSSDLAIMAGGSLHFTSRIGGGARVVTERVAHEFRTTLESAQAIIRRVGCLHESGGDEPLEHIPGVSGRSGQSVPPQKVREIILQGVQEVMGRVKERLAESGQFGRAVSGAVLCGGLFMTKGMAETAEKVLDLPVRMGQPRGIQNGDSGSAVPDERILSPLHAVGLGLLCYSRKGPEAFGPRPQHGRLGRLMERTREWIQETF